MMPWRTMSDALVERYGEKVYKLPVKIDCTCPNRDGRVGRGGCIFCGDEGGSFENESERMPIAEQLASGKVRTKKYGAKKYIAYLQNFSNTYLKIPALRQALHDCMQEDIVGITISTRPDCFATVHAKLMKDFQEEYGVDITIELGLQSSNRKTLQILHRGHTPADFVRAQRLVTEHGLRSCVHLIPNLPWDDPEDVIEAAKLVSALGVQEVKLHALYILKNTELGRMYSNGEFIMGSVEEYQERVIAFLRHLDPKIIVQRVIGRAPEENSLFCNWGMSWWKVRDEIIAKMVYNSWTQGDLFPNDQGIVLP